MGTRTPQPFRRDIVPVDFRRSSVRSGARELSSELARIDITEQRTCALVEHIRINAFGLQESHSTFPKLAFGPQRSELLAELRDLLLKVLLRAKTMVTAEGIDGEICDQQRRDRVAREHIENGAKPAPGDHRSKMAS